MLTLCSSVLWNADFNWTSFEKGLILSASASGHAFTFVSGFFINKFGGAKVVGIATSLIAMLTTLSPIFVRIHVGLFVVGRALEGFFEVSKQKKTQRALGKQIRKRNLSTNRLFLINRLLAINDDF